MGRAVPAGKVIILSNKNFNEKVGYFSTIWDVQPGYAFLAYAAFTVFYYNKFAKKISLLLTVSSTN